MASQRKHPNDHEYNFVNYHYARRIAPAQGCIRRSLPTELLYSKINFHKRFLGHLTAVYCLCFDQTGQFIFTGADDSLIKIWSAYDGRLLQTLRGHEGEITDLSVNFENRLLASGSIDRVVRIWDLKSSKQLECLSSHSAIITSVKFAPYNRHGTDRYLISTSNDGSIIFWSYHVDDFGFKKVKRFQERNRLRAKLVCSAFSTGGSFLACGSSDNCVHVYGFHPDWGPYWLTQLEHHKSPVDSIQFSNHGFRFVSGSQDGTAAIWSFKNKKWVDLTLDMRQTLDKSSNNQVITLPVSKVLKVLMVGWSLDDRYVMTSTEDFCIKVWNSTTGALIHELREHTKMIFLLESHPHDPRIFVSAGHDGFMIIWDIEQGKVIKKFINSVESQETAGTTLAGLYDMRFSPDGNIVATCDSYGYLSLYGYGSGEIYDRLPEQMFFHTDYRALIRDMNGWVLDEQTHIAPHLLPRPLLVDMNGAPYPEKFQSFVPDYRMGGERVIVKPLSESQISILGEKISNHSQIEDDEYLRECQQTSDSETIIDDDATIIDSEATEIDDSATEIDSDATEINELPEEPELVFVRAYARDRGYRSIRSCRLKGSSGPRIGEANSNRRRFSARLRDRKRRRRL